jgi:hypothetical protein
MDLGRNHLNKPTKEAQPNSPPVPEASQLLGDVTTNLIASDRISRRPVVYPVCTIQRLSERVGKTADCLLEDKAR